MKRTRIAAFICALLVLPGMAAAEIPDVHVCREVDLTGDFVIVTMTETPVKQEMPWYQQYRYQYLSFHQADHTYDFVASQHRIANTDDLQKSLLKTQVDNSSPIARKYTIDATGLLTLYLNDRVDYTYRCMVLDKPRGLAAAGDLEFQGYSKQNTLLDKYYRRWP